MTYVESISEVNVLVSNVARITRDTSLKAGFSIFAFNGHCCSLHLQAGSEGVM